MVERICVGAGFVGGRKGVGVTWGEQAEAKKIIEEENQLKAESEAIHHLK